MQMQQGSAAGARGGASRAVRKGMLCTCVRQHPLRPAGAPTMSRSVCGGFRWFRAETAINGAIGPPGGANRRWAVAPIGAGRWRQSALGGGAKRRWAGAPSSINGANAQRPVSPARHMRCRSRVALHWVESRALECPRPCSARNRACYTHRMGRSPDTGHKAPYARCQLYKPKQRGGTSTYALDVDRMVSARFLAFSAQRGSINISKKMEMMKTTTSQQTCHGRILTQSYSRHHQAKYATQSLRSESFARTVSLARLPPPRSLGEDGAVACRPLAYRALLLGLSVHETLRLNLWQCVARACF